MHVEIVIKKGDVAGRRVGRYLHLSLVQVWPSAPQNLHACAIGSIPLVIIEDFIPSFKSNSTFHYNMHACILRGKPEFLK